MSELAGILFAAVFTYAASVSAGVSLLRLLRAKLYRSEILFLGFIVGSACLSMAVFLLTACSLATTWVFVAAGAALVACGAWQWRWVAVAGTLPAVSRRWAAGWWLVYGVFAVLYLSNALMPEISPDALAYHVAFPARYLQEHRFSAITANLLAGMPPGIDMLFLFAYSIGGSSAPAMVHLLFLLTLPFGIVSYARRAGFAQAGGMGALLFFLSPIAGKTGTCAYVDVALASVAFALFYALEIWREKPDTALLAPLGMLAGFAFAIKYTAFLAFPYVLACVLWRLWRARLRWVRPTAVLAVMALAFALPCLIKNQVMLGNPAFPFANRWFPNPTIQPAFEDEISHMMRNYNSVRLSEVPLETTVRGLRLTGIVGPVFLLAPLALLALRRRAGRQVLLAALVFGVPYVANLGTRFLLPCLPFVALALAMAVSRPVWLGSVLLLVHAVLSYPAVVSMYVDPGVWRLEKIEWAGALRVKPAETILRETLPDYEMCLKINEVAAAGEKIFSFHGFPQLYVKPELIISGQSSRANTYRDILLAGMLAEMRPTHRYLAKFDARTVEAVRVSARVVTGGEPWTVSEVRIGHGGSEIPRGRQWRVKASSNIWDAGAAFDNNPVTKWTAGEMGAKPEYLEVDFGGELSVDSVWLYGPPAYAGVPVQVLGRGRDGTWRAVEHTASEEQLEAPARMRRAAVETLKRENIHWLLVSERDVGAQDFAERGRQWGIARIFGKNRFSLYHFD